MLTKSQLDFLHLAAAAAVDSEKATGCPALLSVAQAILESGWGKSMPGNNCFGIKATDSHATYQFTKEYLNGEWQQKRLAFEAYDSLADCFTAHARLIQGGRYSDSWRDFEETGNFDQLIIGISKIYATDPNYAHQVANLTQYPSVTAAVKDAERGGNLS